MHIIRTVFACSVLLIYSNITKADATSPLNPPPAESFNNFQAFEISPSELPEQQRGQDRAIKVAQKIDAALEKRIGTQIKDWTRGAPTRILLIEPRILNIKAVGGATRFFAGAMAGDSRVTMRVKFTDKASGKVVAEPEFYQHAKAVAGAWSFGGTDNAMLNRIGSLIGTYIEANYEKTIGGAASDEAEEKSHQTDSPTKTE